MFEGFDVFVSLKFSILFFRATGGEQRTWNLPFLTFARLDHIMAGLPLTLLSEALYRSYTFRRLFKRSKGGKFRVTIRDTYQHLHGRDI